ncbi:MULTISPECIES: hypothetical protein [unclassified Mesorhizobium]|uniref:hypothetical protein n=1 Tax=unclassified Mesorhizobium TaxID=325217 RepID=UPI000FD8D9FE|nr:MULTISPECIES: hypothetical protein [unclassified Mesorhizobium]TGQ08697.1 hypothetical protein EN862_020830 [Mesorhizobium sp. M2E.F.Ca.ET.219.01.1.1]TGT69232.1 hypothetical protein EN809_023110 [Mesorhizobium sp. M2E.F.Ca.ET.166.01.1.1]TGW01564.1 hypothetical protein EN797_014605 [Mesorhizobium sp. M2E.F.Ca.ET.154.01.1.1]TIV88965.1 MAG: hypothetical protein E5V93_00260 [Mesorhizobium sp.]
MADSDNSTTLSSVTLVGSGEGAIKASPQSDEADPALNLLRDWLRAQHVSQVLCRLQQRLETRVLGAACPASMDSKVGYSIAYQAEVEAATAALKIQDRLPRTPAHSLLGVVAKLEIVVGADRDIDDPTDFPWPHIESILRDLKEIAGSVPLERPDRSIVQADCRRYQAMAADLIGLGNHVADLPLGQEPAIGVDTE